MNKYLRKIFVFVCILGMVMINKVRAQDNSIEVDSQKLSKDLNKIYSKAVGAKSRNDYMGYTQYCTAEFLNEQQGKKHFQLHQKILNDENRKGGMTRSLRGIEFNGTNPILKMESSGNYCGGEMMDICEITVEFTKHQQVWLIDREEYKITPSIYERETTDSIKQETEFNIPWEWDGTYEDV